MIDVIGVSASGWVLLAAGLSFLLVVYACSVFSLQMCMTYFGEEMPSYLNCAGLKLKIIVAAAAILFVGYAFLGSFAILAAPAALLAAMSMIGTSAKCDRFHSAIIVLSHACLSSIVAAIFGLLLGGGLAALGYDATSIAAEFQTSDYSFSSNGTFTFDDIDHAEGHRRNVSHSNPFLTPEDAESNH